MNRSLPARKRPASVLNNPRASKRPTTQQLSRSTTPAREISQDSGPLPDHIPDQDTTVNTASPPTEDTAQALTENVDAARKKSRRVRRPYKPRGPYRLRLRRPHERTDVILQHLLRSRVSTLPVPAGDLDSQTSDRSELDCMRHYPYDYPYLHRDFPYNDERLQNKRLRALEAAIEVMDDSWYLPQGPVAPEDLFTMEKLKHTLSILEAATLYQTVSLSQAAKNEKLDDPNYFARGFALAARKVLDKIKKEEIDKLLRVSDEAVEKLYEDKDQLDDLGIDPRLRETIAKMTKPIQPTIACDDVSAILANLPVKHLAPSLESTTTTPSTKEGLASPTVSSRSSSQPPNRVSGSSSRQTQSPASTPPPEPASSSSSKPTATRTPAPEPEPASTSLPTRPIPPADTAQDAPAKAFGSISKISDSFYNLIEPADESSRTAIEQAIQDNSLGRQHLSEAATSTPLDLADYYQANLFLAAVFSPTAENEPIRLSHGACRIIQTLLSGLDHKLVTMGCHRQRVELTRLLASANYDMSSPREGGPSLPRPRRKRMPRKKNQPPGVAAKKKAPRSNKKSKVAKVRQLTMNPLGMRLGLDPFAKARKFVLEQVGDWTEAQRLAQAKEHEAQMLLEDERQTLLAHEESQISEIIIKKRINDAAAREGTGG
ncbi:hypothetical protein DFQ27_006785 [Actinomortierella ambigua]|uniref:Uncharacterized protein n=1 Tax=Actinomortierella ambigua TaxID=1343610 RepID=A0A9P6UAX8_9FUNG|nr:hypothetical protein DFQ27_006785 [Actinomortierella ambigua]